MKCPVCDCEYFYVQDPDNPSKYYKFKCDADKVVFEDDVIEGQLPTADGQLLAHCIKCVWQGKVQDLKKEGP